MGIIICIMFWVAISIGTAKRIPIRQHNNHFGSRIAYRTQSDTYRRWMPKQLGVSSKPGHNPATHNKHIDQQYSQLHPDQQFHILRHVDLNTFDQSALHFHSKLGYASNPRKSVAAIKQIHLYIYVIPGTTRPPRGVYHIGTNHKCTSTNSYQY